MIWAPPGLVAKVSTRPLSEALGKPVADDLHLIDVVLRERRDEAAAETLILRTRPAAPAAREGPQNQQWR